MSWDLHDEEDRKSINSIESIGSISSVLEPYFTVNLCERMEKKTPNNEIQEIFQSNVAMTKKVVKLDPFDPFSSLIHLPSKAMTESFESDSTLISL